MAARAIVRNIFGNRRPFSMIGVSGRTPWFRTTTTAAAAAREDRGGDVELWNMNIQEHQRHVQEVVEGLKNFRRSLLVMQHHHNRESEGEGRLTSTVIDAFTTDAASPVPKRGDLISNVRRLALQHPAGSYELPRQVVEGVVCITTNTKDAFLLYNPTTGDTSPWIQTTICTQPEGGRQVEYIALGYEPQSRKHKVVCISSYAKQRSDPETADSDVGSLVVEVLTVQDRTWTAGEHKWRKLKDEVGILAHSSGGRFVFVDGPVYVDGYLHWQFYNLPVYEYILEFHLGKEEFHHIPLLRRLNMEFRSSPRNNIRSMLMQVEGNIALLKSTLDEETSSLWICRSVSKGGDIDWKEEKVSIPYAYLCPGSSIEALTGTNFIFIHSPDDGLITYYNRKTKVSLSLKIPNSPIPGNFDRRRIIQL